MAAQAIVQFRADAVEGNTHGHPIRISGQELEGLVRQDGAVGEQTDQRELPQRQLKDPHGIGMQEELATGQFD